MSDTDLQAIAAIADRTEAEASSGSAAESALAWLSASHTDVGRVRPVNEDAFLDSQEQRLWVVADGLGGQSRGDYASSTVVEQLRAFPRQKSVLANLQDIEARLQVAHEKCRTAFRRHRPGTTVAALLAHGNYCFLLWAGDSRIYRLRGRQLALLTQDHSLAQEKLARGELSEQEAASHHSAHVLTRAVGTHRNLRLDMRSLPVQRGDRYLLCSDGLYNPVEAGAICAALGQGSPEEACRSLVDLALKGGGRDNITVVIADANAP
ncbi:PP2C family protein-serine/threonine phosphatase [Parahaliea aestuarii]|uniref:Serine/threonine-protein phosphatase n=1 Tax=Parahaliea aestuarii TaxID=1852021 RepID=A0A5C8ZYC4_9GAMM|nr:protein phosphatase 2C domain-containing protein [Parahaliea aestuarii]TXS92520.1 serine/threonine-protein phosphatase [Parahaliea aestuarii]